MQYSVMLIVEANSKEEAIANRDKGQVHAVGVLNKPFVNREAAPIKPQPWPLLLQALKLLAIESDQGAGDIIERTIGPLGGDAFKAWFEITFGRKCGCNTRKQHWNQKYPITP
jgi:hypothetical protein